MASLTNQSFVVSVITVCYNSALTIADTLKSVANQDWPHIEHIVIDGGSSDGTQDIISRHNNRLSVMVSEPDQGIYDAMNKGLDKASGNIICFLNADDRYVSSNVISQVVEQISAYRLDALIGDVGFFHDRNPSRMVRRYRSDRFNPERLAWGWMPAHPALFLTKQLVQRVGYFKTDYKIAGDYEFIVRAFSDHSLRYRYYPKVLVHMKIGGVSTGGWRAKIRLNQEVLRACRENGIQTNWLKILSKYPLKLLEYFD